MTNYKQCCVCLVPESDGTLKSLGENDGDKAIFFEKFSGIGLKDGNQGALICDKCSLKVDKVRAFIDKARHLESTYFAAARFIDDWPQACRCCATTRHLRRIADHGPEFVQLLLMITGIDAQDVQEKVWICSKCRKTLKRADLLDFVVNENQKLHFNNKALEIRVNKVSPKKTTKSKSVDKITCHECSKSYSNASNLRRHVQVVHEKKSRFNCNFCDFPALFPTNFLTHVATHLDITDAKTKSKGRKLYKLKDESDVHLSCQICAEDFKSIASLKQHFMKHQIRRTFECDFCGLRTSNKKDFSDHIICKHLLKDHGVYDKERPVKCTFKNCEKRFKVQKHLKRHMTFHLGIRYPCWRCQKSYCSSYELKKHQIKCIPKGTCNLASE